MTIILIYYLYRNKIQNILLRRRVSYQDLHVEYESLRGSLLQVSWKSNNFYICTIYQLCADRFSDLHITEPYNIGIVWKYSSIPTKLKTVKDHWGSLRNLKNIFYLWYLFLISYTTIVFTPRLFKNRNGCRLPRWTERVRTRYRQQIVITIVFRWYNVVGRSSHNF